MEGEGTSQGRGKWPLGALALGPGLFLLILLVPPPEPLSLPAWRTVAVATWMATWWLTEAVPVAATAMLPLAVFPIAGIASIADAAAPYANPIIFLFLGGFMLALAMEQCGLHSRIALNIVRVFGSGQRALVGGFIAAAAFLSMWISNTATAVMMLPIASSLVSERSAASDRLARALLLGIAYGASIGGLGTLIGTPPNALLAGYMSQTHGREIGFGQWMLVGVPLVLILVPICWVVLTRVVFRLPAGRTDTATEDIEAELARLGPLSRQERLVAAVFGAVAVLWMGQPVVSSVVGGISDAGVAIAGALVLFAIPAAAPGGKRLLDWSATARLPWGVLVLFGGGLSLAAAIQATGLAASLAAALSGLSVLPNVVIVIGIVAAVVFLTELTSNTATAATFLPVVASLAVGLSADPLLFAAPVALAASCAFMMPVATPPNAIVYGSGRLTVAQMAHAGIWLNLIAIAVLITLAYSLLDIVFDVQAGPPQPQANIL